MTEQVKKSWEQFTRRRRLSRTREAYALSSHEPREIRACILCEQFLDDDDPGQDVVNGEDCDVTAVVCCHCRMRK